MNLFITTSCALLVLAGVATTAEALHQNPHHDKNAAGDEENSLFSFRFPPRSLWLFRQYVNEEELDAALEPYATTVAFEAALEAYATNSAVDAALEAYATISDTETALEAANTKIDALTSDLSQMCISLGKDGGYQEGVGCFTCDSSVYVVGPGPPGNGQWNSLQLGDNGNAIIASFNAASGAQDLVVAICNDAACSNPIMKTLDSDGDVGRHTSMQLNSNGAPVISYYDSPNEALKLAICDDSTCSTSSLKTVDTGGQYTSLKLNGNGAPVISHFDINAGGSMKLAICNDAACSSPAIQTVDSSTGAGLFTSLQLDGNGNAIISYYDDTNKDLKIAFCNDATCSSPIIKTIDSTGDVGKYASLQLNGNGVPVIAYYDGTNSALKLATCNDAACSSNADIKTIDGIDASNPSLAVGEYASLQLKSDGNAIISYRDSVKGFLMLAICNDAACSSPVIKTVNDDSGAGTHSSLQLDSNGVPFISSFHNSKGLLQLATYAAASCLLASS